MFDLSLCGRAMVVFNFLPSKTLHPSRNGDYASSAYLAALAAVPASAAVWHRRWSHLILQKEDLLDVPVTDVAAKGLPIAVMQGDALTMLVRRIGVVLCAPRLRYAISGEAVRALCAALGGDVLRWIRDGRRLHPGLAGEMFRDADEALHNVTLAGHAALYTAFEQADPAVARRLFLKLPPLPQVDATPDAAGCPGAAAGTIDREVATAIDNDVAMGLVTAVQAASAIGGEE
ncbi:SctK family type III secretion system sorting platform protein [Bordetella sp. H567]|uniref:SctK family type III secretion system sorting platform protein n=1 Tax=Bordetella sp. H567 TaxID=1697043 RepID=UPI000832A274|nr:SctK family type III secretion system sorting platform protein [Bordetella sp. H567]